ncbi:MAG: TolC family protein [Burkholderiales bacterium]|nr:TolC family protein [Burkholderiales bacterium]
MKHPCSFIACAIAGSALASIVWAQDPSGSPVPAPASLPRSASTPSLAGAIEAAWQRAVSSREAAGRRGVAQARRAAASSPWAAPPAIDLKHRTDRWQDDAGRRESEVALAWPLLLPGQRSARGAAAEAGVAVAEAAEAAARLQVAGEVREAAWALEAHRRERDQADAAVDSLRRLAEDVDRRVEAGDLARADALAARAELLGATAQRAEANQRVVAAEARWLTLTGTTPLASAGEPLPPAGAGDPAAHPDLRAAAQATEHARRGVELARASRFEPPELSLGYRRDEPGRGLPAEGSIALGLRVPFGTDDRNRPMQAAALAELEVARTHEQRLRERLSAEALSARSALDTAERQAGLEAARAAMLRERANLVDKSFRAGESALPDLLRALAAATQAEAAQARQSAALGLARARLNQTLGILP